MMLARLFARALGGFSAAEALAAGAALVAGAAVAAGATGAAAAGAGQAGEAEAGCATLGELGALGIGGGASVVSSRVGSSTSINVHESVLLNPRLWEVSRPNQP